MATRKARVGAAGVSEGQIRMLIDRMDDQHRATSVLLERMEEQNRATIEAVVGLGRRMNEKFEALEARLTARIEALEFAVRKNSEDIRRNSADIESLKERVEALAKQLDGVPTKADWRELEARVARLEQRLGL